MRLLNRVTYAADGSVRPNALVRAVLVFRWGALVWLVVLVLSGIPRFPDPAIGPAVLVAAGAWTVYLTLRRPRWSIALLVVDLALSAALLVVDVATGYFATVYPLAAPLTWAAVHGFRHGLASGGFVSAVLIGTHLRGGSFRAPFGADAMYVVSDAVTIMLAASGVGVVSSLLRRSGAALRIASAGELAAHEAAARLAERDSLGREIHDSVLQALAMVHKRSRELASSLSVPGTEVAALAELAAAQEVALRGLLVRPTPAVSAAAVSVRRRLEAAAEAVRGCLDITLSAVEGVELPAATVQELGAAVDQALANVIAHADTRRVWIFADVTDTAVVISVRDDGRGFVFDPPALRRAGRMGLLGSIIGRIEDIGGAVRVAAVPGGGTELELCVPRPGATA